MLKGLLPCLPCGRESTPSTPSQNPTQAKTTSSGGKAGGLSHASFIHANPGKITDYYDVSTSSKKALGEGAYVFVTKSKHKATKTDRSIKRIKKAQIKNPAMLSKEINLMKLMDHPNIIKLYETFEDNQFIYMVMELCSGGELFDKIVETHHFTENQAAIIMQQMIRAVYYMHELHVAHRDLKPENFLFLNSDRIEKNTLKLIDFGLSTKFTDGQVLTTKAGTPYYVAPQVLAGKYDKSCDMWSVGVMMYVLLSGYPPFYADRDEDVLKLVKRGKFSFGEGWRNISQDAKDLITKMLTMDTEKRLTAAQAVKAEWVVNHAPKAKQISLESSFVDKLRAFRVQNRLKKAALHVIASHLSEDRIHALRETFMSLDKNGDGLLTHAELAEGLQSAGLKDIPPDMKQILQDIDSDGSGVIDYTEFLAATIDKRQYLEETVCWGAFVVFDRNGDGVISMDELKQVLGEGDVNDVVGADTVQLLMKDIDQNGDGKIDFQEFMGMMRGKKVTQSFSGRDDPPLS